ncbi:MAG: carbohydrate ABC transporter permease [Beutenbergiaceae bacterium]
MTASADVSPRRRSAQRTGTRWLWLFLIPAALPYLYVVVVPSGQGLVMSLTNWNGLTSDWNFVGIDNYLRIFGDATSTRAIVNTFTYALVTTVVENTLGLLIALALHTRIKSRNALRVLFFTPVVLLSVVVAYLWQYLFQSNNGAITSMFQALGFSDFNPNWLGDPNIVVFTICVIVVWQFTGYTMVIYLAGLQGVPQDQLEAAALDGAGPVTRFWYVVRPLLAPAITVNLMLSLIRGFMIFDQIWATTAGGPADTSHSLSTLVYRTAFQFGEMGLAAAIAVVLAVFVSLLGYVQYRSLLRGRGNP